jgi:hypothetical protein
MSLKIFHIFFILLSAALCAGVSWWCFSNGIGKATVFSFAIAAVMLPAYGVWFLWRTRKLIL